MPLYVVRCEKCKRLVQMMIPLERYDEDIQCPDKKCKGKMKRLMSPVYFRVK